MQPWRARWGTTNKASFGTGKQSKIDQLERVGPKWQGQADNAQSYVIDEDEADKFVGPRSINKEVQWVEAKAFDYLREIISTRAC